MSTLKNFSTMPGVVIRFDSLSDSQYPNGAWYATVDDDENVYDKFYGLTPNEALAAWEAAQ